MDPELLKMVLCSRDLEVSRRFYTGLLGFSAVEEWDQEEGRGFIVAFGDALLEVCEVPRTWGSYDPAYEDLVINDKVALQLKTSSVASWAERLSRGRWDFDPPVDRPWGHRYLYTRDPDGLRIAFYEVIKKST
jgi:catechol 2,3-dioxygenase-like lactoylglutathione lyase family enzyme